jgi:type IV pilus assembly protein PilY1
MDLVSAANGTEGERVVTQARLHSGRVSFYTLIPEPDPCSYGGRSWYMDLIAVTGGRSSRVVFDVNQDGIIDSSDLISSYDINGDGKMDEFAASGQSITDGGQSGGGGTVCSDADATCDEWRGDSSGKIERLKRLYEDPAGRKSWRQLR